MDKEQAIEEIMNFGVATLIEALFVNGENDIALQLLQECWGDDDEDVIDYIEENWNF